MARPRILTFNFHEPYLCLMARTGLDFTVGVYEEGALAREWQTQFRPIPPNLTLVPEAEWRRDLAKGQACDDRQRDPDREISFECGHE